MSMERKYKQNLKNVEKMIGVGITDGGQLYDLSKKLFGAKFRGIYDDKDKLPKLKAGECLIINRKTNEHWVAMANIKGKSYKYDSFNRPSYRGGYLNGDFDNRPDQKASEHNCGQRCIAWLVTVLS
jgi:hypothetical protein